MCAPIAPYDETRRWVRGIVETAGGPGAFVLVWISTPIEECARRDPKGLYSRAKAGKIKNFTGIDAPYEAPQNPEIRLATIGRAPEQLADEIIARL